MIGNTILLKHTSNIPQGSVAIQKLFDDAGTPLGLYTNFLIPSSRITKLVEDYRIKGVSL